MKAVSRPIPTRFYRQVLKLLPLVCVDLVVVNGRGRQKNFLLVKRKNKPEAGLWWFPGGRIFKNEQLREAVLRKLKQETGLTGKIKKQLGVYEYFSKVGYYKGFNSHMIAIVFLVEASASRKVVLDWQSVDSSWFDKINPRWHSYIKKFLRTAGFNERKSHGFKK